MDRIMPVSNYINDYLRELRDRKDLNFKDICLDELLHTYGVAYFSALLARKRGLDIELAYIAGLFHDVGRIVRDVIDESHGPVGAELAREVLIKLGMFSGSEVKTICSAVGNHSNKNSLGREYDEVLKDADVMERIFSLKGRCEDSDGKRIRLEGALGEFGLSL